MRNFGRNLAWRPRRIEAPGTEEELLAVLRAHAGRRFRVAGALHSWSAAAVGEDVQIDLRRMHGVEVVGQGDDTVVRAQGGCRIERLLAALHAAGDRTLPTLGAIRAQSIAGAISTATHGSGRPSLSHFVRAVRVAHWDGAAHDFVVRELRGGPALAALRCALGCIGVIVAVELETVPRYCVDEHAHRVGTLVEALAAVARAPLTYFVWFPHADGFAVFERSAMPGRLSAGEWWRALPGRVRQRLLVDELAHLLLAVALRLGRGALVRLLGMQLSAIDWRRRDEGHRVLTFRHDRYRHEEMEVFVPASRIEEAVRLVREAVGRAAGDPRQGADARALAPPPWFHHYPVAFRRVLPESGTLIAMIGGATEDWYAISLLCYAPAGERDGFRRFCAWLAAETAQRFGARLHWGKLFTCSAAQVAESYAARLDEFRDACRAFDPEERFSSDFTERVLGIGPGAAAAAAAVPASVPA